MTNVKKTTLSIWTYQHDWGNQFGPCHFDLQND
jgi:hypothetical protein